MSKSSDIYSRDEKVIAEAMRMRFFPLTVSRGEGAYLIDEDGKRYLDFNSGWGMANVGYSCQRVIDAVHDQSQELIANCLISSTNEKPVALAEELIKRVPGDFQKKVWFGHSGSDANEFIFKAIPLATGRPRIMSFVGSYHGQTMGSYALSGHPSQGQFLSGGNVVKIPYPYCYRCPFGKEEGSCGMSCLTYIEDYILKMAYDAEQIGAVLFESVESDGGDIVPPEGFFKGLEEICKKNGIWVIADEVKIGFGRTGKMFGFEYHGITPDAVVLGKPIAGGLPLSAVVGRAELMDAGHAIHMFTTAGDPTSSSAALAVLETVDQDGLIENARVMGDLLKSELLKLKDKYDCIGDVRGQGLIIGVELVKNRETKEPDPTLTSKIAFGSFREGLLYFVAGIFENVLEITPPLIITEDDVKKAVDIIEKSIQMSIDGTITDEMIAGFTGWS